jgi:hypothetical protein
VQILAINTARHACITGDLTIAEELLSQDIHTDANDYTSYAHRSFVMARKHAWDLALEDAIKVSNILTHHSSFTERLTFIRDTVHQHSPLIDRLHLQRHRPLRQRPPPGGKGSIRRRVHVHKPRVKNQPFSSLDQGTSNLSRIFSTSSHIPGHRTLQRRST